MVIKLEGFRGGTKEKTRIHHQHISLGEELPGLHRKCMKKNGFNKTIFDESFYSALDDCSWIIPNALIKYSSQ